MNVSLSPEQKAFVRRQVGSGRFRNDSEVIREGLRLLEDQERQRLIEEKLLEALDSGRAIPGDASFGIACVTASKRGRARSARTAPGGVGREPAGSLHAQGRRRPRVLMLR